MNPDNDEPLTLILVLIGDLGVGKSSLLLRFTDDTYTDNVISNIDVVDKCRTVESDRRTIKLIIRDTAGTERFRSLTGSIFRGANGILIAYDITDDNSFHNVKDWLHEVDRYTGTEARFLVGTKCDLVDKRAVEYRTAKEFADERDMSFFETSAKNGTNVEQVFMTMVAEIMQAQRPPDPTGPTIHITASSQHARQERKSGCC